MQSLNNLLKEKRFLLGKIKESLLFDNLNDFKTQTQSSCRVKFHLVGLDVGSRKCGLAISDDSHNVAVPLNVIKTDSLRSHLKFMKINLLNYALIIGLPLTLNGIMGSSCVKICSIVNGLSDLVNEHSIPLWFHDERYTTSISYENFTVRDLRKNSHLIDHHSAMQILQEHLDLRKILNS